MKAGLFVAIAWALAASPAWACGFCNEDASAATYDLRLRQSLKERGLSLAVFRLHCGGSTRLIEKRLQRLEGVDAGSVRLNCDAGAGSFGYDPHRTSAEEAIEAFNGGAQEVKLKFVPAKGLSESKAAQ